MSKFAARRDGLDSPESGDAGELQGRDGEQADGSGAEHDSGLAHSKRGEG